ncbi:MAG: hypothetical protein ABI564_09930 [Ideonella sp.]
MRTLPAVELDIPVQPAWTRLVDALGLLASAAIVFWWLGAGSAPAEPMRSAWLAIGMLVVLLALHARRSRACRLRWDGQQWFWATAARADGQRLVAGRVGVMLDLQWAMLLRFEPAVRDAGAGSGWIAVSRRGLAADWHELRCALFSRQPAGADADVDASPLKAKQ